MFNSKALELIRSPDAKRKEKHSIKFEHIEIPLTLGDLTRNTVVSLSNISVLIKPTEKVLSWQKVITQPVLYVKSTYSLPMYVNVSCPADQKARRRLNHIHSLFL